jgi:citrate synthase
VHSCARRSSVGPHDADKCDRRIGALACELGFPPRSVRGLGVLARAIGLVGHIMEEWEQPMAVEIWRRVDEEVSEAARKKRSA